MEKKINKELMKKYGQIVSKQNKWDLEHHMFHIGEMLTESSDMMNNRLSEIHNELKSIEQCMWRMIEEIHRLTSDRKM